MTWKRIEPMVFWTLVAAGLVLLIAAAAAAPAQAFVAVLLIGLVFARIVHALERQHVDRHLEAAVGRYMETGENQWATANGRPNIERMRREGRESGYPECCVDEFARDVSAGRFPGQLRGLDASGRYVPCSQCKAATERSASRA